MTRHAEMCGGPLDGSVFDLLCEAPDYFKPSTKSRILVYEKILEFQDGDRRVAKYRFERYVKKSRLSRAK